MSSQKLLLCLNKESNSSQDPIRELHNKGGDDGFCNVCPYIRLNLQSKQKRIISIIIVVHIHKTADFQLYKSSQKNRVIQYLRLDFYF